MTQVIKIGFMVIDLAKKKNINGMVQRNKLG